jgi:hypothetical protein
MDGEISYFSTIPADPWGNAYILEIDKVSNNFMIVSTGPDGLRSVTEEGDDINNNKLD